MKNGYYSKARSQIQIFFFFVLAQRGGYRKRTSDSIDIPSHTVAANDTNTNICMKDLRRRCVCVWNAGTWCTFCAWLGEGGRRDCVHDASFCNFNPMFWWTEREKNIMSWKFVLYSQHAILLGQIMFASAGVFRFSQSSNCYCWLAGTKQNLDSAGWLENVGRQPLPKQRDIVTILNNYDTREEQKKKNAKANETLATVFCLARDAELRSRFCVCVWYICVRRILCFASFISFSWLDLMPVRVTCGATRQRQPNETQQQQQQKIGEKEKERNETEPLEIHITFLA